MSQTSLRLRVVPRYPASVTATDGIKAVRSGVDLVVKSDYSNLVQVADVPNPDKTFMLAWDSDIDNYQSMSFTNIINNIQDAVIGPPLAAIDATNPGVDQVVYFTGEGEAATYTTSEFVRSISNAPDEASFAAQFGAMSSSVYDPKNIGGQVAFNSSIRRPYEAYLPTVTRVGVDVGSGFYRHVPAIAVKDPTHILGAYLLNPSSASESAAGQVAVFVRSSDDGGSWSAPVSELNDAGYANNPLTPEALQGEIFVTYDRIADQEIATVAHRGGANNAGFIAFRDAVPGAKWQNYRLLFLATTNEPLLTPDVSTSLPPGYRRTFTLDGKQYEAIPFKPAFGTDGTLVIPITLAVDFATDMRVSFLIRKNGVWSMGGVIPLGVLGGGSGWEPTTWQAADGTWYCQCRNNLGIGNPSYDNHAIATTGDLSAWSPFAWLDEDIHLNRQMRGRFTDGYFGCGTTHNINRDALSVFVSTDGHRWVYGFTYGAEPDGVDFSQYSDIDIYEGTIYSLYSESVPKAAAPNTIRFARFNAPVSEPVMGSLKNYYVLDGGTAPSVSGTVLTIPPRMVGSLPTPAAPCLLNLRARVTVTPNANKYTLFAIGDAYNGYFTIEYRNNAGACELWVGGTLVKTEPAPTEWRDFTVAIDTIRGIVSCMGIAGTVGRYARTYLGDVVIAAADQAGNIEYDASRTYHDEFLRVPRAAHPRDVPIRASSATVVGNILSSAPSGNADVIVETSAGNISNFRHRVAGSTKAVRFYNDAVSRLYDLVGGVTVCTYETTKYSMQIDAEALGRFSMRSFANLGGTPAPIVIASGVITPVHTYTVIDTEGAAASDDLTNITATVDGDILILRTADSSRDVTVKHGVGNIFCGSDRILSTVQTRIMLECRSGSWFMISYSG